MQLESLLLGFDIASPAMLGWLVLALAPWLIHLWSRRRYREVSWAAMEYLLAAMRQTRRRMHFEQWLLLLIRTLIVLLIVSAAAEPFLESQGVTFVVGQRTHRVLVLDGSFSMEYTPDDVSLFDKAKALARRIVEESSQGDGFTLLVMASPPEVVVGSPVFDTRDFLLELDALTCPHKTMDLPASLAAVERVLSSSRREHSKLKRSEIYFLTDLGRNGWSDGSASGGLGSDDRRRLKRLADQASLVVLDLGQANAENVAVVDVTCAEPLVMTDTRVRIDAVLKNFGHQTVERQSVELLVDGRRASQTFVDVAPGRDVPVAFTYQSETSGVRSIELRAVGDKLDVDNHRWFALPVVSEMQTLLVEGRPGIGPYDGSAGYLARALSPVESDGQGTKIHARIIPESAFSDTDLAKYQCVFFCDVGQFTAHEVRMLDRYLRRGGSAVFFLGPQVLPDRYNRELIDVRQEAGPILPARLGPIVDNVDYRLDPLDYLHPIVDPFREMQKSGLLTTPFDRYFRLHVDETSGATVVVRTALGDPLIVERPVHQGRVVLVATSADTAWGPMPLWLSYVPIVQEILRFSVAGQIGLRNLRVGEPITVSSHAVGASASATIRTPDGRIEPLEQLPDMGAGSWTFDGTTLSGTYFVSPGDADQTWENAYAVNVDTAESDLAKLTVGELRGAWDGIPLVYQTSWESQAQGPVTRIRRTSDTSKTLLFVVLLLLLAEMFLARRFGHYRT